MHKITMQVDFTIGKLNMLFHEDTIFRPLIANDGIVDIAELYIFLCKLLTDAHIQIIFIIISMLKHSWRLCFALNTA